jgi:DNA-binding NarL/FixJ family response regulator
VPYISGSAASSGTSARQRAPPAVSIQDAQEDTLSMQQLKTYIVEDSQVIRENLIATLEELVPVEVVGTAEDESTAVQWLARHSNHADLLIVDIFLKAGSGLGVLRAAGALPQRRHVVVLSNYATPDMRRKCLELGADKVFDKSNEIDALILYCGRLAAGEAGHTGPGALA